MTSPFSTPLEQVAARGWGRIDPAHRSALAMVITMSVLAFGFEMTNLTFHHDDVTFIFVQDTRIGSYLGRFGFGWLHYYTQGAHIMPFLQLAQAIVLMTLYGLAAAKLWQLDRALDIALTAGVLCVFPYMAQIYQYNFCTVPFALAHLLAAAALLVSVRASPLSVLAAAVLYAAAFSIYQAVLANAATLAVFWLLSRLLFGTVTLASARATLLRPAVAGAVAAVLGGLLYVGLVAAMGTPTSSYQGADEAFSLRRDFDLAQLPAQLVQGSRAFFLWPENYLPGWIKALQLVLLLAAGVVCLLRPRGAALKLAALALLGLGALAPRTLQVLHPGGTFHSLTLTAYAVTVAGSLAIVLRATRDLPRNAVLVIALALLGGYVVQCNWISTVNHQNTVAHFAQATQLLARLRALPDPHWDGRRVVVAGSLDLFDEYPFRKATGVATEFLNARHLQRLTRLLRDRIEVVAVESAPPAVREAATKLPAWPHAGSVTVVDGMAVVVLSHPPREGDRQR